MSVSGLSERSGIRIEDSARSVLGLGVVHRVLLQSSKFFFDIPGSRILSVLWPSRRSYY